MSILNKKNKMNIQRWFFWIGIGVVIISHILMLFMGLSERMIKPHAWINIGATLLIFVGAIR